MLIKGSLAALLMAATVAFSPVVAEAKTKVHINIGVGWPDQCIEQRWDGYCGPEYGYYRDGRYYDEPPPAYYRDNNVSCGEARQILRDRGFRRVTSRKCGGGTYVFTAVKHGNLYRIAVRARNGAVVSVERI